MKNNCLICDEWITRQVISYSMSNFDVPLCIDCQQYIREMEKYSTYEAIRLYFALKMRGIPAELEKFDGYKHIDIAIPSAKVNIEVDGLQHNFNKYQALSDLKRTYHSFRKGYFTLRIPNSLVSDERILEETADYIVALINDSYNQIY